MGTIPQRRGTALTERFHRPNSVTPTLEITVVMITTFMRCRSHNEGKPPPLSPIARCHRAPHRTTGTSICRHMNQAVSRPASSLSHPFYRVSQNPLRFSTRSLAVSSRFHCCVLSPPCDRV